jgi:hypothetical protein
MIRSRSLSHLLAATTLGIAGALPAQSVTVPAANENTRGAAGLNTVVRQAPNARTYMMGIAASELSGIPVGSPINGISLRSIAFVAAGQPTSYPTANATWANYDIQIGNVIPLNTWTTTFLSNFMGTPTTVRSGQMVMDAGSFTFSGTLPAPQPEPWGTFYFDFQRPFVYTGGDIGIYITHTGSDQANAPFLDTVNPLVGSYTAMSALSYNAVTSTGLNQANAVYIMRLHFGYGASCPGTGGRLAQLVETGNVAGGGPVSWAIGNGPANAMAVLNIGLAPTNLPILGCTVLTLPITSISANLNALGRSARTLTAPAGQTFSLNVQGVVLDPGSVNGFFVLTNGTTLNVTP